MDISQILSLALTSQFDPNQKYVIAIQGPTTSGKSTIAKMIYEVLQKDDSGLCRPALVSLDNFYKGDPFKNIDSSQISSYNFDCPAALDWKSIADCMQQYISGNNEIKSQKYDFSTKKVETTTIKNNCANIIIVEGIFAHNAFNENVFNVEKYSCIDITQPSDKNLEYVQNRYEHMKLPMKVLKIYLNRSCKKEVAEARKKADKDRENKSESLSTEIFEKLVWPSTLKWVSCNGFTSSNSDLTIENGSRNHDYSAEFLFALFEYFKVKYNPNEIKESFNALEKKIN